MVYLFLADGFETIEALTVVDMLRRSNIEIQTVSMNSSLAVTSAHRINVEADVMLSDIKEEKADMYVLPGGLPGTTNLKNNSLLISMLKKQYREHAYLAAICAAPSIFSDLGFLEGRQAICYPDYEEQLSKQGAIVTRKSVVVDDNIITSRGMGTSIPFSAAIISVIKSHTFAKDILQKIIYED